MAPTATQIATVRRMVAEPTTATYSDALISAAIARYALDDARGEGPLIESETTPGTLETNPDWTETYDLNAAAAEIWAEKAASYTTQFDFADSGQSFARSQTLQMMMQQARYYSARRSVRTITLRPEPLAQGTEILDDD